MIYLIEGSEETYYCDDERDPHEEVETSEDVVENFLPILRLWRGYNIFAQSLGQAIDSRGFKTQSWGGGEPLVDQINGKGMNVDLTNGICFVWSCLGFLLYMDRQCSIPFEKKESIRKWIIKGKTG